MRRTAWLAAAGVAIVAGGAAGHVVLGRPSARAEAATPAERAPQPVLAVRVAFAAEETTRVYTGTIRPRHEAALGFRLSGKLVARLVEVGDRVEAGQVVARLDGTDAALELDAADAELASARTDLVRAEAAAARARDLFSEGHVAQAALDRATSDAAEARSRVEQADRAAALARNRLAYTTLVAHEAGVVTATQAEAGQVVDVGRPVVSIARTDALDAVFALPEQERGLLDGAVATAELWDADGAPYALILRDVSPDVDPAGRTYRVRMALSAPDARAALGRTVTVRLTTPGDAATAPLPLAAVTNDGDGPAVWRVTADGGRVERVPVELAAIDGRVARVRGPLADGARVVGLGAHKLDPARPVRVVETVDGPES